MKEKPRGGRGQDESIGRAEYEEAPPEEEGRGWSDIVTWAIFLAPLIALLVLWIMSIKTN